MSAPLPADPLHVGEDVVPVATVPLEPALDPARSSDPSVCPFLRRDFGGTLLEPATVPGMEHACIAVGEPRPQSLRQQELVCLRVAHADCPLYLRGTSVPARSRRVPAIPGATLVALVILVLSAALSFAFVVQRGGISMPVVGESPTSVAVVATSTPEPPAGTQAPASVAVEPTPSPAPSPSVAPSPTASPAASPTPPPSPTPSPAPTATATPTPRPTAKPSATPKSDRYALLRPCPDRKKCYIYAIRSGDNLFSIARYFGHSLSTIYRWNPQYPGARLRAGDPIRMPPPTR
jgi:hypothetical protein